MSITLEIVLILIVLVYVFVISKSVKKKTMTISYLIFWVFIALVLVVALLAPNFIEKISTLLGFEMPINMIFSFSIFITLYLIFDLTKLITKEQNKNVLLTQEISILRARVEKLEEKIKKEGNSKKQ